MNKLFRLFHWLENAIYDNTMGSRNLDKLFLLQRITLKVIFEHKEGNQLRAFTRESIFDP